MTRRMFGWFDERLGAASFARRTLNKVFPDHWSFMLGEIALYCFIILILTGVFLTFFYVPDAKEVIYHGSYAPLRGQSMSRAYDSVIKLSFDVRAGLVFRQIHHWAALIMVGSVAAHASRVFFTGAFRKPRDLNWMLGVLLLLLTIAIGFAGYSLPDDLLSGTGLRIAYSIVLSIPIIGTWLAFLLFGGRYPSPDILNRLFVLHVMILPGLIAAVLTFHLIIVWRQKHTHFPGGKPVRTESNIQGERLFPRYAFKSTGLFLVLGGILGLYNPTTVSGGSQPDWYVGWLEGALRLFPGWEIRAFGHEIPAPFFPGVVLPGIVFTVMFLWPMIERRITGDRLEHNLLNFPRDIPWRTAFGAAVLMFMTVLTVAGGNDLIASFFGVSVEAMTRVLRVLVFVLPVVAFAVTYYLMNELRKTDLHPVKQAAISTVVRTREGGFEISEKHVAGGLPNPEGEETDQPEVVRD
jgi:ubiquinol-cytochrome c reductase cytochrome b subunit